MWKLQEISQRWSALASLVWSKGYKMDFSKRSNPAGARSSHSGLRGWILCRARGVVSPDAVSLQSSLALAQHLTSTCRCSSPESGSTFHWDVKRFINNWKQSEKKVPPWTNIYIHDVSRSDESGRKPSRRKKGLNIKLGKSFTHELLLRGLMTGEIKEVQSNRQTTTNNATSINKYES